jgi:hypothetical protein
VVAQRLKKYARDLRSLPNDVAAAWRSDGAAGVTLQLRRRSIDRLGGYVRYIVIEADMLPLQPHDPSDCEIRCFTDADWSLLGDLVPLRLVAIFEAARSAGRLCLVAWQGTTAEGYIWLSPRVEERHENFALDAGGCHLPVADTGDPFRQKTRCWRRSHPRRLPSRR